MDDEEQDRECALPVIGTAARQVNPSVECALSVIGMGARPQLTVIGSRS